MSKKIKGIIVEIGGNTVGLNKALEDTNKKIKSTSSDLKDVEKLLKFDPKNTELLKQKQELLKKAVAETSDKLKTLKESEIQAQEQFKEGKISKEQYDALKREIIKTEQALDKLEDQASKSNVTLQKVGKTAGTVAEKTSGLSLAAAGALAGIGAGMVNMGAKADDLNTLAKQTGFTTEELQKFYYAADIVDVAVEDMTKAAAKMTKNMVSTSSEVKAAWKTLGVSMTDISGETRSVTDIFYDTLKALSLVRNETERDQLAMQIFGKTANQLAGIVDDGGAALKELGEEAENAGLILSQDALDSANEFNDVLDKAKASLTASGNKIFAALSKDAIPALEKMADVTAKAIDKLSEMPSPIRGTAIAALAMTAAISPTAKAIESITVVAPVATKAIKALKKAMNSSGGAYGGAYGAAIAAGLMFINWGIGKESDNYNKFLDRIEDKYNTAIENSNKSYKKIINNLENEKTIAEETYHSEVEAINKLFENKIDGLADTQKELKKALENERELYEKAHEERLNQLEKEKQAKLDNISREQEKLTAEIQSQIDALDDLTEAEEKAKEEKENAEKLEELKNAISSAKTYAEKVNAEKEYTAEVKRQEEEKTKTTREEQKKQLQDKISQINSEAERKKEKVNEEYNAAVQLEEDKYNLAQEGFEKRLEALDTYIEDETKKLEALKEENLQRIQDETEAYIAELQKKIDKETELKEAAQKRLEAEMKNEKNEYKGVKGFLKYFVSDYNIPGNASGTNDWRGGLTYVHENGGELINLPRHTQIIPHDLSVEYMRAAAKQGDTINNYGARQQFNVFEVDGQVIQTIMQPKLSVGLSNSHDSRERALGVKR